VTQTIAITGASAGIGRAAARLFAQRGDRVALIARGHAGLEGAVRDVEREGGVALAVSADVADFAQVDAAATQIEDTFGPIDVWVNVAFASVFAPFEQTTAGEFRRVTEVTYLGFVHGTMAALARMRLRDRGVIVQVQAPAAGPPDLPARGCRPRRRLRRRSPSPQAVPCRGEHRGHHPGQPGSTRPARQVPGQNRLRLAADR
jgi:NAD(P)-dependent dehydrogenase (short-subunit alcohol dehydrogenase family)